VNEAPRRPLLRWHGGKWMLAPWIISHFPKHRIYVEPFGGAGSVLIRKERSYAEVYNDLDECVVNLFRVLRDKTSAHELIRLLRITPFARAEYELSREISNDPIEEARRLVVRSYMGFGSDAPNRAIRTGFRAASNRSGTTPAHDWSNYPDALHNAIERLQGVVVEKRDAMQVMQQHDAIETLHYVDPPYLPETRSAKSRRGGTRYHAYAHEMTTDQHVTLLSFLTTLKGTVVLSGYPAPMYENALSGWHRVERAALADGAKKRTEVLWINRPSIGVFA
jgi:DNA adenine methylase